MTGKRPHCDRFAAARRVGALAAALTSVLVHGACTNGSGSTIKGSPPFRRVVIDANPVTGAECCSDVCALGDLDGDGYLDVVIGSEKASGAGLVWYQYPTWRRRPIGSGQFTTDGQTTDMDGDGDIDIVISDYGSGIYWYENPSDLEAASWPAHRLGEGFGHDLELGDLDGDGDVDVVTCDKKRVVAWENEGPDGWSPHTIHDGAGEGTALADIDADGDLDVVFHGLWLENPVREGWDAPWVARTVAPGWHAESRVQTADMNGDGRTDVVLSVSEGEGQIAWFACPSDRAAGDWQRHDIEADRLIGVHGLQVADFDSDGDLDVAAAEMHTSPKRRVVVYLNEGGAWRDLVLSREGSHNIRVADVGADGDMDVVGKNYAGEGRVIELWENLTAPGDWDYFAADERRPGDERWKMGLVYADVDGDGYDDIVAGSSVYRNPGAGGMIKGHWERTHLDKGLDTFFCVDVDGDELCDLVGMTGTSLVWVEATDPDARGWTERRVAEVPDARTQGYTAAQLRPGGAPELVFTRGKGLYYAVVPAANPERTWEVVSVGRSEEEGVAAGDVDGDGDLDLAAVADDGHHALWFENPGTGEGDWPSHPVGTSSKWLDRVALVDLDGDGRRDVVVTEETQDWDYNAGIYWFQAPADRVAGEWRRHTVAVLRSVNSMDVADLDGDGDVDIVAAEHTDQRDESAAPDNLTAWFENPGGEGRWIVHPIDISNRSSHLGVRVRDLDRDGDLDLASMAWRQYRYVHVWLNFMGE